MGISDKAVGERFDSVADLLTSRRDVFTRRVGPGQALNDRRVKA